MTSDTAQTSRPTGRIGVVIQSPDAAGSVDLMVKADALGIPAVWMTTGGIQADAITLFAAAGARTERIVMGSAIIPTWPRNPVFIAQQAQAVEAVAPGRLRLGIGPSTEGAMRPFGVDFRKPAKQLREYITVLKALLQEGSVEFSGEFVRARARIAKATGTPVMASALQEGTFRLCGEIADGAISWVCPWSYIQSTAIPAIRAGAEKAGRPTPPLIMHTPTCVSTDMNVVRAAAQRQCGAYAKFQFYNDMFRKAGHPEAAEGLSDSLIDDLVVYGDPDTVAAKLAERAAQGFGEVMAMPLIDPDDRDGSTRRVYEAVARANQAAR